ncbi:D-hydantoinase [Desulfosporosinus acidiphilus SJ4]|uniref:D-hydantoinase n=1 Tax=Desulfosporosinus acidiphilus (strain DSM 22704 / JCM 16185 / SJ4) TaxID=646529 RepID=I4D5F5_DESAJ|nr:dihydropyrimidinase [Desulfosporosinus acidiphilus]AFM41029.1 D-hydantoinase [Desulfosporosinus acidiphilus SJ4]
MGIVLNGGTVVTAADVYQADVRIEGERIAALGFEIEQPGDQVINVDGCFIVPGGIDPHTHFDLPAGDITTSDDFYSGTRAALLGGTTTIIDYATQFKGESLKTGLENWHKKADGKCFVDYGFHMAITDWNDSVAQEMTTMVHQEGVPSFKLYMAYKNVLQVDDAALLQALRRAGECEALVCVHCENGDVVYDLVQKARQVGKIAPKYHPLTRPPEAEAEAASRVIALAQMADAPVYIVHLTCSGALQAVIDAKLQGREVYAETCPQYLLLDESYYDSEGFNGAKYVISPPLRPIQNQAALWTGLQTGILETMATDHCAFNYKGQKELGLEDFSKIPNGAPGVETRMGLLYTYGVQTGKLNLNEFVALTSTNAAKLFGLFPRKGTIAPGSDADLVVWDPRSSSEISVDRLHQQVDYTPFEGFRQQGKAIKVFLRGKLVCQDGELIQELPAGKYLFRNPFLRRKDGKHV